MAVDPKYFDWGGSFLGGLQQAHEGQRRNALLDLENRQYGLQERRLNMAEQQMQAEAQNRAREESIGRKALVKDPSVFQDLGIQIDPNDPEIDDLYAALAERFGGFKPRSGSAEPYTLGPGSARYDARGQLIAERPFSPPNQTVIQLPEGQAAFNPRTGGVSPLSSRADQRSAEASDAAAKTGAQKETERLSGFVDDGVRAADGTATIRRSLELLNEVKTGGIDVVKLKVANLFGVTGADEGELSANLGKAVLSQLRSTFGAQFTEQEGKRLEGIEAGFGKSTEANKRLLDQALKIMERAARRGLDAAEKLGDDFSANEIRNALGTSLTPGAKPKTPNKGGWSIEPVE